MTVIIDGTNGVSGVDGSASTPSYQGADNNTGMLFPAADTIAWATGGTERMRVDSSGNLLVGTTSGAGKLRVKGGNDNTFILDNDGSQYTAMYMANNGTAKTQFFWDNTAARTYVVSVTNGVYLASGGTSWTAVSDERKKDIIEPISDAANKVSQLRAVIGKYKTDEEGTRRSFLIAQDVQAIFPEAVDSNNPDELGLSYTDTIPLLVAAIKELKAEVDSLKAQLEAK